MAGCVCLSGQKSDPTYLPSDPSSETAGTLPGKELEPCEALPHAPFAHLRAPSPVGAREPHCPAPRAVRRYVAVPLVDGAGCSDGARTRAHAHVRQCRRVARDEKRSCATRLKGSPFDLGREDVISADGPTTKAQGLRLASSLLRRASVWHGDYPAKRGTYRKNETSSPFRGQLEYMYAPVVSTLLAGLRAAPNSSQVLEY